ncbi:hypothetical protein [Clostridium cavendishii]|nr:hypothetical protein [Clostridium cavendishii]
MLEFDTKILLRSYQYYAYPIGIIFSNTNYGENVLLNKFTNVFCGENLQYYECGYREWDCFYISEKNIKEEQLINTLINSIYNENYIDLNLNEFFVPHRRASGKFNFIHNSLIIGYDLIKEIFIIAGYDENQILNKTEISFNEIIKAVFSHNKNAKLTLIKIKEDFIEIIEETKIVEDLLEYCLSNVPNKILKFEGFNTFKFGIEAYIKIEKLIEKYKNVEELLVNDIYFIYEHKNLIMKKLNYLFNKNIISKDIIDKYKLIVKESQLIKNIYIKFWFIRDENYFFKIKERITFLILKERGIMDEVKIILEDYLINKTK